MINSSLHSNNTMHINILFINATLPWISNYNKTNSNSNITPPMSLIWPKYSKNKSNIKPNPIYPSIISRQILTQIYNLRFVPPLQSSQEISVSDNAKVVNTSPLHLPIGKSPSLHYTLIGNLHILQKQSFSLILNLVICLKCTKNSLTSMTLFFKMTSTQRAIHNGSILVCVTFQKTAQSSLILSTCPKAHPYSTWE